MKKIIITISFLVIFGILFTAISEAGQFCPFCAVNECEGVHRHTYIYDCTNYPPCGELLNDYTVCDENCGAECDSDADCPDYCDGDRPCTCICTTGPCQCPTVCGCSGTPCEYGCTNGECNSPPTPSPSPAPSPSPSPAPTPSPSPSCESDCTHTDDNICHADCNGKNDCSLVSNCDGKTKDTELCNDKKEAAICCEDDYKIRPGKCDVCDLNKTGNFTISSDCFIIGDMFLSNSNLTIPSGVTVTILANSTFTFNQGYQIIVNGTIVKSEKNTIIQKQ